MNEKQKSADSMDLLMLSEPWPLRDIVAKLCEAADILQHQHNYDVYGWESIWHAREAARKGGRTPLAQQIPIMNPPMNISKKPIEQQISWLSSHAAGVMKAHPMGPTQADFWQTVLNVTNEVASLRNRVGVLESQINDSGQFRIGSDSSL